MIMISILYLDHREKALKELLPFATFKMLDHGDIVIDIGSEQTQRHLVFERKTLADLAASIKDGRYHKQKASLLASFPVSDLFYIIEGPLSFQDDGICYNGINNDILVSSVINTAIRDNIKVFVTKDVNDTCSLIKCIFDRVNKDPSKYLKGGFASDASQLTPVCMTKKNVTKSECYIAQLCQIPGVSQKVAQAVIDKYPTFKELIMHIELSGANVFKGIKVGGKAVSCTTVSKVVDFLS